MSSGCGVSGNRSLHVRFRDARVPAVIQRPRPLALPTDEGNSSDVGTPTTKGGASSGSDHRSQGGCGGGGGSSSSSSSSIADDGGRDDSHGDVEMPKLESLHNNSGHSYASGSVDSFIDDENEDDNDNDDNNSVRSIIHAMMPLECTVEARSPNQKQGQERSGSKGRSHRFVRSSQNNRQLSSSSPPTTTEYYCTNGNSSSNNINNKSHPRREISSAPCLSPRRGRSDLREPTAGSSPQARTRAQPRVHGMNTDRRKMVRDPCTATDTAVIEIAPGITSRLRGARETWYSCVENDDYTILSCIDCRAHICCIPDASYVLCPRCRVISPLVAVSSPSPSPTSHTPCKGGVGLGFTLEQLQEWQCEVLSQRRRRRQHQQDLQEQQRPPSDYHYVE